MDGACRRRPSALADPRETPMPDNHCVATTPDHPSFPSARASQAVVRYSRRRLDALDFLSYDP